MTTPFISITVSILYFAWLWHDGKATDRIGTRAANRAQKTPQRIRRLNLRGLRAQQRRPVASKAVGAPIASGATP